MNCTHQNTTPNQIENQNEISPLKARLNRMAIHVPGNFPTPAEVIPVIEQRLAAHMKHISRTASSTSGDYVEWKQIHDAYTELLTDLREEEGRARRSARAVPVSNQIPTHQNNFSPKKSPPSESTVGNQPLTPKSKAVPSDSLVISGESVVIPGDFEITSSDSKSPKTTTTTPASSQSKTSTLTEHAAAEKPFDIREQLDAASLRVCFDFQEYLSGRSPLDNLTPVQQSAVLLLLEDYTAARVVEVLAQPEPYGLNLKTSEASLNRFRRRVNRVQDQYLSDQDRKSALELLAKAHESDEAFQTAVQRFIKTRLLNAARASRSSLDAIDSLITSLTKLRKQTLAERKQSHAETKK